MTGHPVRARFWVEVVCGTIGFVLLAVTLLSREWIEFLFGVDPDGGSGALEFTIALGLLAGAATAALLALREWRRPVPA